MKKNCIVMVLILLVLGSLFYLKWAAEESVFPFHAQEEYGTGFVDAQVIVMFKEDFNPTLRELTPEDFPELEIESIEVITHDIHDLILAIREAQSKNDGGVALQELARQEERTVGDLKEIEENFNMSITITLKNKGSKNVHKAIELLKKRNEVYIAQPNYIYHGV